MTNANYRHLLKRYAFYAPRYDRIFRRYSSATLGKALEAIPLDSQSWLLDVACGTGLLAEMLLTRRPNLHFTGVDISPQMLQQAQSRLPYLPGKYEWLAGCAESLPVPSDRFDVLTCTNAFHLVQNPQAALAEFRRVLKPGGVIVIVDWCLDFRVMRLREAALRVADRQKRSLLHLSEMVALVQHSGFQVQQQERFVPRPMWGLMCVTAQREFVPAPQNPYADRSPRPQLARA